MGKRTGYIVLAVAVTAFVAFAVMMERASSGSVRVRVEVKKASGYGFVDYGDIRAYVEKSIAKVAPDSLTGRLLPVEKRLSGNPYLEKAMVYRQPSGDVKVELWEETPGFRILTDTGNYYVSRRGRVMPVKAGVGADVPLVYGRADKAAFPLIDQVLGRIAADDFFSSRTVGIEVSRRMKNGKPLYSFTIDTRENGLKVVLGTVEDMDVKFENFAAVYAYLLSSGRANDYKIVNLEFGNYLICQKK